MASVCPMVAHTLFLVSTDELVKNYFSLLHDWKK